MEKNKTKLSPCLTPFRDKQTKKQLQVCIKFQQQKQTLKTFRNEIWPNFLNKTQKRTIKASLHWDCIKLKTPEPCVSSASLDTADAVMSKS